MALEIKFMGGIVGYTLLDYKQNEGILVELKIQS
jgi:hypothetical protein